MKLPSETFAQNKERLARFERDARLLASLNHPRVPTLHRVELSLESGQHRTLVKSGTIDDS